MNKIVSEIGSASFLLALLTGLLYISGESYLSSYSKELELPIGLFQSPFNEILSHGFYMVFIGGIYLVIPSLLIAAVFFLYAFMIGEVSDITFIRKVWSVFYRPKNNENRPQKPKLISKAINLSLTAVVFIAFVALVLFTTYYAIEFSSQKGREGAQKKLKDLKSVAKHSEIQIKGISLIASTINCSDTHCALYVPEANEVRVVPVSDIESIIKIK